VTDCELVLPSDRFIISVENTKETRNRGKSVVVEAVVGYAGAPVGASSAHCRGGAGGYKGGDGEVEKDGDAAIALPQAVAPVGAPCVYHYKACSAIRVMNTRARCAARPGLALPGCLMR
jgi:hypothetical protein